MTEGFRNVYVIHKIDWREAWIVGVFEAEGLAEMARERLEAEMTDRDHDNAIRFSITAFQVGKIYN